MTFKLLDAKRKILQELEQLSEIAYKKDMLSALGFLIVIIGNLKESIEKEGKE